MHLRDAVCVAAAMGRGERDEVCRRQARYRAAAGVEQRPHGIARHEAAHAVRHDAEAGQAGVRRRQAPHLVCQARAAGVDALVGCKPVQQVWCGVAVGCRRGSCGQLPEHAQHSTACPGGLCPHSSQPPGVDTALVQQRVRLAQLLRQLLRDHVPVGGGAKQAVDQHDEVTGASASGASSNSSSSSSSSDMAGCDGCGGWRSSADPAAPPRWRVGAVRHWQLVGMRWGPARGWCVEGCAGAAVALVACAGDAGPHVLHAEARARCTDVATH
jgi:hypothetical protein